jgi:hypothetical protein
VTSATSPVLSASQLATLRLHGEERSAAVGDVLFRVGDRRFPFIAIVEGEAAILDAAGKEIIRHGASGFLGEINILTGQRSQLGSPPTTSPIAASQLRSPPRFRAQLQRRTPSETADSASGHERHRATFQPRTPENIGRSKLSPPKSPRPSPPSALISSVDRRTAGRS